MATATSGTRTRGASGKKKTTTTRKPVPKVQRKINVEITLKGTGCYGAAETLKLSKEGTKFVADGDTGKFKCELADLREALRLLDEDVVVVPRSDAPPATTKEA